MNIFYLLCKYTFKQKGDEKKKKLEQKIQFDSTPHSQSWNHTDDMADSKENYYWDLVS